MTKLIPYAGKVLHRGPKTRRYPFRGESMTVAQIAKLTGLSKSTIRDRAISGTLHTLDTEASS